MMHVILPGKSIVIKVWLLLSAGAPINLLMELIMDRINTS